MTHPNALLTPRKRLRLACLIVDDGHPAYPRQWVRSIHYELSWPWQTGRMDIDDSGLMRLDDALAALGRNGDMGSYDDEISLSEVVGTVARESDFAADFSPRRLDERWRRTERLFRNGSLPPPIEVVRLGDLLFVRDGHHRVAVARSLGWDSLPARVQRICTVAYALCCLRVSDLPAKAAERRFLERVPLPDEVSRGLWLEHPADWARLADAAFAWGYTHTTKTGAPNSAHDLASAWWWEEVRPVITALRHDGVGMDLSDVQLYVTALAARDRLGALEWSRDLSAAHGDETCCRGEIVERVKAELEQTGERRSHRPGIFWNRHRG